MPKLNAPAEIHWRRSNINTQDPILMKSVEVLKDCRSLNAASEMNCPMPRSVEKVPIRNEKRCRYCGKSRHTHCVVLHDLMLCALCSVALCRTAEIGALLLKCVLIVYIWPEKGVNAHIINMFLHLF